MSIAGHPHEALLRGKKAGCRVIQIFSRSRAKWVAGPLTASEVDAFHKAQRETAIDPVAIHCSYLINVASSRSEVREKSLSLLLNELEWARLLNIPYLVMHPGSHLGDGERKGITRITEAINRVHGTAGDACARILLETTAGQGRSLGCRFDQLAEIFERVESPERVGVCFDTCHAFAAGYDFRTKETYKRLIQEFDRVIGLKRLKLFHLNDSKAGVGSKRDRHEHPGTGQIGLKAFSLFLNDPGFAEHPFLLETPKGVDEKGVDRDIININLLSRLIKKAVN